MPLLKNIHLLTDISEQDKLKMEHAALEHSRYSNISFKIVEIAVKHVIIAAYQGKNSGGNYFNQKRLIEIVHETFDRFFPDLKIKVHATVYRESPVVSVDSPWIQKQMLELKLKLKDISADTGVDYANLSSLVSGDKPISQPMKALFYYYFLSTKLKK